jgi:lipopolysaccharide transport system permease protein
MLVQLDPLSAGAIAPGSQASDSVHSFDAAAPRRVERALIDLRAGAARWRLAWELARTDISHRYRGSVLGPLWLTLSTGVMLVALGLLYSTLLEIPLAGYLPWLAASLILWNTIAQVVGESCGALTGAEGIIRLECTPSDRTRGWGC